MQARLPYVDRIWRVTSFLELDTPMSAREAFERLDPLFQEPGTDYSVDGEALVYAKKNPGAQDKLATFTSGTLAVEEGESRTRLHYDVGSTALFLCFLAPLFFLAFGQFAAFLNEVERPAFEAEKAEREAEKEAKKDEVIELHWIDQMLGATAPDKPGDKDTDEKARDARDGEEDEDEDEGYHSPMTSYVFAGIFLAIYLVGRVLEPYLLKRTFRAALLRPADAGPDGSVSPELYEEKEAGSQPAPIARGNPKS